MEATTGIGGTDADGADGVGIVRGGAWGWRLSFCFAFSLRLSFLLTLSFLSEDLPIVSAVKTSWSESRRWKEVKTRRVASNSDSESEKKNPRASHPSRERADPSPDCTVAP